MGSRGTSVERGSWPGGPAGEPAIYVRRPLNPGGRYPHAPRESDPWRLEVVYVQREGRLVIANLRVYVESPLGGDEGEQAAEPHVAETMRATLPPEGLTSANLRSLNLSQLRRGDEAAQREIILEYGLRDYLGLRPKRPRPRSMQQGRALTDDEWAGLCIDYLEVVADPRYANAPLLELVKRYQRKGSDLSDEDLRRLLRDRLALARRHDWLTGSGRGRAGGKPGPRLLEWKEQAAKRKGTPRKRVPKGRGKR